MLACTVRKSPYNKHWAQSCRIQCDGASLSWLSSDLLDNRHSGDDGDVNMKAEVQEAKSLQMRKMTLMS